MLTMSCCSRRHPLGTVNVPLWFKHGSYHGASADTPILKSVQRGVRETPGFTRFSDVLPLLLVE